MKIFVTGAAGFIGYHLSKELLKNNFSIIGIDNLNNYYSPDYKKERIRNLRKNKNFKFYKLDLKNKKKLLEIFKIHKPEVIYHLASQPGIMYSFKNPNTYLKNNIQVTDNLIEYSKKFNVKKFYFTSSSSVYGLKKKFPIKEKASLKPINLYAKTKKKCEEKLLKEFGNTSIDLKIFRPFTVYGEFARPDMIFLTYFLKAKNKSNFYLFNNGNYIRDFTYVGDVVAILKKFLFKEKIKNKIFNICSSNPIKVKQIISLIQKYSSIDTNLINKPYRKGEMIKTYGDNRLIKKTIKFRRFTSIESGIKKTIKWYSNFKNKKLLFFNKVKY